MASVVNRRDVRVTTKFGTNGATTWSYMNFSGYVAHVTMSS